jgi:hypothetical protein
MGSPCCPRGRKGAANEARRLIIIAEYCMRLDEIEDRRSCGTVADLTLSPRSERGLARLGAHVNQEKTSRLSYHRPIKFGRIQHFSVSVGNADMPPLTSHPGAFATATSNTNGH